MRFYLHNILFIEKVYSMRKIIAIAKYDMIKKMLRIKKWRGNF